MTLANPLTPVSYLDAKHEMVFQIRHDSLTLTSQGYWLVDVVCGRTGLQTYYDSSYPGGKRVEYRALEDISNPTSLASFAHAPIPIMHPQQGFIYLENSPGLKKGYLYGAPWIEHNDEDNEEYILCKACLDHPDLVDGVRTRQLVEGSLGYNALFDATPGTYRDQHYDGRQKDIRINHYAALPHGMARAGRFARFRVDGHRSYYDWILDFQEDKGVPKMGDIATIVGQTISPLVSLRLDAHRVINLPQEHAAVIEPHIHSLNTKIDTLQQDVTKLTSERDLAQGLAGGLQTKVDGLETKLAEETKKKSQIKEFSAAYEQAKPHLKDGQTIDKFDAIRDIHVAALATLSPKSDYTDKSDDVVMGAFTALASTPVTPTVGSGNPSPQFQPVLDALNAALFQKEQQRQDQGGDSKVGLESNAYQAYCDDLEQQSRGGKK